MTKSTLLRLKKTAGLLTCLVLVIMGNEGVVHAALLPFTSNDLLQVRKGLHYRDAETDTPISCPTGTYTDPIENAEEIWKLLADKLPAHQIAGIIGNMAAESGVQPQRLQNTKPGIITPAEKVDIRTGLGWGLVQWTPARKIIDKFTPRSDANALDNQIAFLWDQLEGRGPVPELSAGKQLKATTNPTEAAEVFARKYERPAGSNSSYKPEIIVIFNRSLEHRKNAANAVYHRLKDKIPAVESATSGESVPLVYTSNCGGSSANDIVSIAKQELSKAPVEYDDNVLKYSDGREEPWCADFVSWVYKESGNPFFGGVSGGWRFPGVLSLQAMFKNTEGYAYFEAGTTTPQPGDVAFYIGDQTPDSGSTRHVNIVISVEGDKMVTIGGNESDTVKQSTRSVSFNERSLVGFGRKL